MKLKKLFSKTIFIKNIKRFWPVWGAYLFVMFWLTPILIRFVSLFGFYSYLNARSTISSAILDECISNGVLVGAVYSLVLAFALFGYLHKENSCYFFHALPVTKKQLFATNFCSGAILIIVPNIIITILTVLFSNGIGYSAIGESFVWFCYISAVQLFFFSLATVIMIISGHPIITTALYCYILFFYVIIIEPINEICNYVYFGIGERVINLPSGIASIVFPMRFFMTQNIEKIYDGEDIVEVKLDNWSWVVLTAVILVIVNILLSLFLYKKRNNESAGDSISIKGVKVVFRWVTGLSCGIVLTRLLLEMCFYNEVYETKIKIITVALFVLFSVVALVLSEMIARKEFRVLKRLKYEIPTMAVCCIILGIIVVFDAFGVINRIPEKSQIEKIEFSSGTSAVFYDDAAFSSIIDIHQEILDNKTCFGDSFHAIRSLQESPEGPYYRNVNIFIKYYLKDGSYISRNYYTAEGLCTTLDKINTFIDENLVDFTFSDNIKGCNYAIVNFPVDANNAYAARISSADAELLYNALKKDYTERRITLKDIEERDYYPSINYSYIDLANTIINTYDCSEFEKYNSDYPQKVEFEFNYSDNRIGVTNIYYSDNCIETVGIINKIKEKVTK